MPKLAKPVDLTMQKKLFSLLRGRSSLVSIDAGLTKLEKRYGVSVFRNFLYLVCHLDFNDRVAKQHWKGIIKHHAVLAKHMKRKMDFRVALLDYFTTENKIRNPKVIEIHIFQQTAESSIKDELTGLFNFRYFREALEKELKRAQRHGHEISLAMLDIDDFKAFNDRYGHLAGNEALKRTAQVIIDTLRVIDIPCRYGGEEFAVILPMTPKDGAFTVMDRVRTNLFKTAFRMNGKKEHITLSGGVAVYPSDGGSVDDLIAKADQALYRAKSTGKNNVKLYSTERRSYIRVSTDILANFRLLGRDIKRITLANISRTGLLFRTKDLVNPGSLMELRLHLPGGRRSIDMQAVVVRAEARGKGDGYDTGVRISRISQEHRKRLNSFVKDLAKEE